MNHDTRWDARIARAQWLASHHPAASQILSFYAELAGFQKATSGLGRAADAQTLASCSDDIVAAIPAFLEFLSRSAPSRLVEAAAHMGDVDSAEWHALIERYWRTDAHDVGDLDPAMIFVVEALLQPFAEAMAIARPSNDVRDTADVSSSAPTTGDGTSGSSRRAARCPACSGKPVVGVLREDTQSARRSLVCGLCLTEWPWPRIVCPACGEDVFESLPVYHSEAFPAARVDACDSCQAYLKTIDLSKDALAIPVVDELATVPLDLWAREQGYTKVRLNLLRM